MGLGADSQLWSAHARSLTRLESQLPVQFFRLGSSLGYAFGSSFFSAIYESNFRNFIFSRLFEEVPWWSIFEYEKLHESQAKTRDSHNLSRKEYSLI